jgi:3-deoxy-manno-octulosonate cytidylyltransferase (CMP-KDO synthetase)
LKTHFIIPANTSTSKISGGNISLINKISTLEWVINQEEKHANEHVLYVATADEEIHDLCKKVNILSVKTSPENRNIITDTNEAIKTVEELRQENADVIILVQNNEPVIEKKILVPFLKEVELLFNFKEYFIIDLISKISTELEFKSQNVIKTVHNKIGEIIYFSKLPIPHCEKWDNNAIRHRRSGIVAFKRDFLMNYQNLSTHYLEIEEGFELLRFIEHGYKILSLKTEEILFPVNHPFCL